VTSRLAPRSVLLVLFLLHEIVFWSYGLSILALDLSKRPFWLYRYKIQKKEYGGEEEEEVSWDLLKRCLRRLILSHLVFVLLPMVLSYRFTSTKAAHRMIDRPLPSWTTILRDLSIYFLCQEVGFYFSHLLLHRPFLYSRVHKIHHEFRAPTALAAEYAHPVEFVLSNIIPGIIGPVLMRSHLLTNWLYICTGIALTLTHHSGYAFPWLIGPLSPRFHDFHHSHFSSNFGTLGILDRLFGTDAKFREFLRKEISFSSSSSSVFSSDSSLS